MTSARPEHTAGHRLSGRVHRALIGVLILALGIAASAFTADEWRSNLQRNNRRSFTSTASDLSSTLHSKLEADLEQTRTLRTIATLEPKVSDTRFKRWYDQLRRGAPAPIGVASALIEFVPASKLSSFLGTAKSDASYRAFLAGQSGITPSGRRPLYCLARAIIGSSGGSTGLYHRCWTTALRRFRASAARRSTRCSTPRRGAPAPRSSRRFQAFSLTGDRRGRLPARHATRDGRRAARGADRRGRRLVRQRCADPTHCCSSHRSLALALYHHNLGGQLTAHLGERDGGDARPGCLRPAPRGSAKAGWLASSGKPPTIRVAADEQGASSR